jgi:hypothetical protein
MSRTLLSEEYVQEAFHRYLKSSLTQAKAERLLDEDLLSSAEGDLMITGASFHIIPSVLNIYLQFSYSTPGPALCFYFAALRSTTNPPSVPLPRNTKGEPPRELSAENCPPAFASFLYVWSRAVPVIQSLPPEQQHDLARIICNLEPLTDPLNPQIAGIAADLRAVAIEISQRRSFQDRYADDLQAALDAGSDSGHGTPMRTSPGTSPRRAGFVPPPTYEETSSNPSSNPSPLSSPSSSPRSSFEGHGEAQYATYNLPPQSIAHLSPMSAGAPGSAPLPSGSSEQSHRRTPSQPPSPSLLTPNSPGIDFIRETLYAALADVLERQPSLRKMLKRDPARAYFASVSFAILDVAMKNVDQYDGSIIGVLGKKLTLAECPRPLQPFMTELSAIGKQTNKMEEEDQAYALEVLSSASRTSSTIHLPQTQMERVMLMLEEGVGYKQGKQDAEAGRRSIEGRAVQMANRINALSLGLTRLRPFRERQDMVFKVLAGVATG